MFLFQLFKLNSEIDFSPSPARIDGVEFLFNFLSDLRRRTLKTFFKLSSFSTREIFHRVVKFHHIWSARREKNRHHPQLNVTLWMCRKPSSNAQQPSNYQQSLLWAKWSEHKRRSFYAIYSLQLLHKRW